MALKLKEEKEVNSILNLIQKGSCVLHGVSISIEEFVPRPWDADEPMGAYNVGLSKIVIDNSMSPETKEATLIHEIIHAIDKANALGFSEQEVSVIATGVYSFLKDNGLIMPTTFEWKTMEMPLLKTE
jgi:hypothetical protein